MKQLKKFAALLICSVALLVTCAVPAFAATTADLFRYLPTDIEVTSQYILVKGYFVNMNTRTTIYNLTDYDMNLYVDGEILASATFGTVNVTVPPQGMVYYEFRYAPDDGLNTGTYSCNEEFYASVGCHFSVSDSV